MFVLGEELFLFVHYMSQRINVEGNRKRATTLVGIFLIEA
jgi:hypothetical protein